MRWYIAIADLLTSSLKYERLNQPVWFIFRLAVDSADGRMEDQSKTPSVDELISMSGW